MVRRLRLALLIVAVGVTIYLAFPAFQTLGYTTSEACGTGGTFSDLPTPGCGRTPAFVAAEQRDAWLDFARVEIIVVMVAAALWVLAPSFVRERPPSV